MKHKTNRDTGTDHIVAGESEIGGAWSYCGESFYGGAEIKSPEVAAMVADNLCGNCRRNMPDDEELSLYELADEADQVNAIEQ